MCTSSYWKDKSFIPINELLMEYNEIDSLNRKIANKKTTMVCDLEKKSQETFDGDERRETLSSDKILGSNFYIKGQKIDNQAYFSKIQKAILDTGYTGKQQSKYGICTNRADLKAWPIEEKLGYSPTDTDDEMQSSAMNLNEPFVIQSKCEIDGNTFYWGYSTNCTGWVNAKNVAICETREEWLDYWKVETNANDFVVVTGSRINLKNANLEDVSMMLGTIVKLVPQEEIPGDLASQAANNYIVYFAGVNNEGKAFKKYAVLSKTLELSQGFVKLTQSNVLDVAFSCIGDAYGWAGADGNMDCSLYTRYIYRCFGFELPRNTTWQEETPEKYKSMRSMTDEEKIQYVSTLPTGSLLYFEGHTMVYIGMDENKNFVVSDLGTVVDEVGDLNVESVYAVTVNSLDVRRGAKYNGTTWLHNLTGAIVFMNPIDISKCKISLENESYTYDGTEKEPKVTMTYEGKNLYEGTNFEVAYSNNINAGTATIKITGKDEEPTDKNKTPLEAMKDSLANLKLPFTGAEDYGYFSTPYFLIHLLAILVIFAIYILICKREIKNSRK